MSHEITIEGVEIDYDYDGEGHPAVTALIDGRPTAWYVLPRHCSAGRDGWEIVPEAGCLDADIEESLGHTEALRIGREVVALANFGLASCTLARPCECECECIEDATTTDEGVPLCDECSSYYLGSDSETVCRREQDARSCRHCEGPIAWGPILTGRPGTANYRVGRCSCREWRETEAGGDWRLSEGPPPAVCPCCGTDAPAAEGDDVQWQVCDECAHCEREHGVR